MADDNNLKIQLEINEALRRRSIILDKQTSDLKDQVDIATKLKENLESVKVSESVPRGLSDIKRSLAEAVEEAEKFDNTNKEMNDAINERIGNYNDSFDGFLERIKEATKETSTFGVGSVAFLDGMISNIGNLKNVLTSIAGLAFGVADGMFQIGKAIFSIPFKMFNALVEEANRVQGGTELAQAFENIRKEFGNFKEDVSKNVIASARSMRGELANTGLSVYRTAGMLHERLDLLREIAEKMGADFHVFGTEIRNNAEVMIAYQKALAMTGEEMAGMSAIAVRSNKSLEETFRQTATMTTGLGSMFGISQKTIAKDIGEMVKDLKNFGSVGIRQMAQLSVYSKKLGVSFKELLGIVDKFDNFQDAAENAARLSQAFGVNIDVIKQMNEQDPGKRVDNLRQAFFNAGKSIERMTRQERAYLAQTSGIEDSALDQVFALKNQKIGYDEIAKSGGIAEKQQLTTAEAMQKLAASIERIVRSGSRQGGFWDRFMLGFATGARRAMAVDKVWRNIRKSLWQAEMAGRAVGRMFIRVFPGMNQISKGFAALFNPKKFKELRSGVVGAFGQLFKELKDPTSAKKALSNFFANLKKAFAIMATKEMNPLSSIFEGFKKAFKAVGQIFLSGTRIVMENITKFLRAITSFIKNKDQTFSGAFKEVFGDGDEFGGIISDIFSEISNQLGPAFSDLGSSIIELLEVVWDKASTWISKKWESFSFFDFVKENPKTSALIAGVLFGPAFIQAGVAMLGTSLMKIFASKSIEKSASGAGELLSSGMGKGFSKNSGKLSKGFSAYGELAGSSTGGAMAKGMLGKLKLAGAVIGAAIAGWEIGKWLDEEFKISTKISEAIFKQSAAYQKEVQSIITNQTTILDASAKTAAMGVENQQVKNALLSGEENKLKNIQSILNGNLDISLKEKQVLLEQARLTQDMLVNKRLAELGEQKGMTNLRGTEAIEAGKKMRAQVIEELKKSGQIQLDPNDINKQLTQIYKTQEQMKAPKKIETPEIGSFEMGDYGTLSDVKKLDPKKLEETKKIFAEKVRPALLGKGGIKDTMIEITTSFKDVDTQSFYKISQDLQSFSMIPASFQGFMTASKNLNYEKIVDSLNTVNKSVVAFHEIKVAETDIKSAPVVQVVSKMTKMVNKMNDDLSRVNSVNLKPKLQNLGRTLGFGGNDQFTIHNKNFKVEFNINVTMDVDDVSKVLIESGRVSSSKIER